jgi:hypothetical protein
MDSLIYLRAFRLKAVMSAFWPADVVTIFVWFDFAVLAAGRASQTIIGAKLHLVHASIRWA